jgi:hypothetical protein
MDVDLDVRVLLVRQKGLQFSFVVHIGGRSATNFQRHSSDAKAPLKTVWEYGRVQVR